MGTEEIKKEIPGMKVLVREPYCCPAGGLYNDKDPLRYANKLERCVRKTYRRQFGCKVFEWAKTLVQSTTNPMRQFRDLGEQSQNF